MSEAGERRTDHGQEYRQRAAQRRGAVAQSEQEISLDVGACGVAETIGRLLSEGGVQLSAAQQPGAGEGQDDSDTESKPGQDAAHYGAGAKPDNGSGHREQQDESGGNGDSDQQRLGKLTGDGYPLLFASNAQVEAHVGGQHGESARVERRGDSGAEREPERRDYAQIAEESLPDYRTGPRRTG